MKQLIPISILCLAAISCSKKESTPPSQPKAPDEQTTATEDPIPDVTIDEAPSDELKDLEATLEFAKADDYVQRISTLLAGIQSEDDLAALSKALGDFSPQHKEQLKMLLEQRGIDTTNPIEKIGEIKANKHARWSINLKDSDPILLDVKRDSEGNWKVDKIVLPKTEDQLKDKQPELPNSDTDALNYTYSFLKSLLNQDFKKAKEMVDSSNITDAKLAGLCIIFEEANYTINPNKPLRALFIRETAAGFYVNVTSKSDDQAAQFSIITQRDKTGVTWSIYEINLDSLLGDYAQRVSQGDVYFTPLLKNPEGGDTLVIYFEFDSEGLTDRTRKQLNIVSRILKVDPNRTITISGHTDSKGGVNYNNELSNKRAESVKNYFIERGVSPEQVMTEAHGDHLPRLPNTKSDGSDNPEGRRANRRTEIYLDF